MGIELEIERRRMEGRDENEGGGIKRKDESHFGSLL